MHSGLQAPIAEHGFRRYGHEPWQALRHDVLAGYNHVCQACAKGPWSK